MYFTKEKSERSPYPPLRKYISLSPLGVLARHLLAAGEPPCVNALWVSPCLFLNWKLRIFPLLKS